MPWSILKIPWSLYGSSLNRPLLWRYPSHSKGYGRNTMQDTQKIDQVQHHQCGKAPKGWGCEMVWHEDVAWKWKEMVAIIGYYYDVNLIRCKGELLLQTATPPTFLGACWLQCSTESSIGTKIRDRNLFHPKWFQKWITKQKQPNPIFLYQLLAVMTDEKTKSCIQILWKISLCFEGLCIGFSEPAVLCKFGFCNRSLSRS